jgi:hypothetical protein
MSDLPTHRHKLTGDIVFFDEHLKIEDYEVLPETHWEDTHGEARRIGEEKGAREAKFKGWTIEEVAAYFEARIAALEAITPSKKD